MPSQQQGVSLQSTTPRLVYTHMLSSSSQVCTIRWRTQQQQHGHHLVECAHCSKAQCRLWWTTEQLQDRDGRRQLLGRRLLHVDDGMSCFIDHHLTLVSQTALQELIHWTVCPTDTPDHALESRGTHTPDCPSHRHTTPLSWVTRNSYTGLSVLNTYQTTGGRQQYTVHSTDTRQLLRNMYRGLSVRDNTWVTRNFNTQDSKSYRHTEQLMQGLVSSTDTWDNSCVSRKTNRYNYINTQF